MTIESINVRKEDTANENLRFHSKVMGKNYRAGLLGNSDFVFLTYVACVLALVRDSQITLVRRLNTHRLEKRIVSFAGCCFKRHF